MSEESRILAVDAGHTRIKFALCTPGAEAALPQVQRQAAFMLEDGIDWTLMESWRSELGDIPLAVATGSNPTALERVLLEWPRDWPVAHRIPDKSRLPLRTEVLHIERVGIDRLLNAIAANRIRQPRQTALVVDTGTAVTVDCINSEGIFRGGAILPGVRMSARALHLYTSTLPHIEAARMFSEVPHPIGRHTEAAIDSGLYWGHVGAVRELILRMRDELASFDPVKDDNTLVLITGGAAPLLKPHFSLASFEPQLALQGLALAAWHLSAADAPEENV